MYSIIETAKENGLHPYRYVEFLLETLPNTSISSLEAQQQPQNLSQQKTA